MTGRDLKVYGALSVGPQRDAAGAVSVERGDKYAGESSVVCVSEPDDALVLVILLRLYLFYERLCGVESFLLTCTTLDFTMA